MDRLRVEDNQPWLATGIALLRLRDTLIDPFKELFKEPLIDPFKDPFKEPWG